MGQEVYNGIEHNFAYKFGVQAGSLGLALNSFVLALMSWVMVLLSGLIGGVKWLWEVVNVILVVNMAMTIMITKAR